MSASGGHRAVPALITPSSIYASSAVGSPADGAGAAVRENYDSDFDCYSCDDTSGSSHSERYEGSSSMIGTKRSRKKNSPAEASHTTVTTWQRTLLSPETVPCALAAVPWRRVSAAPSSSAAISRHSSICDAVTSSGTSAATAAVATAVSAPERAETAQCERKVQQQWQYQVDDLSLAEDSSESECTTDGGSPLPGRCRAYSSTADYCSDNVLNNGMFSAAGVSSSQQQEQQSAAESVLLQSEHHRKRQRLAVALDTDGALKQQQQQQSQQQQQQPRQQQCDDSVTRPLSINHWHVNSSSSCSSTDALTAAAAAAPPPVTAAVTAEVGATTAGESDITAQQTDNSSNSSSSSSSSNTESNWELCDCSDNESGLSAAAVAVTTATAATGVSNASADISSADINGELPFKHYRCNSYSSRCLVYSGSFIFHVVQYSSWLCIRSLL
jgi:hypothetical protein